MSPGIAAAISAVCAIISVLLTLVTVIIAVRSLRSTADDSRERSRPVLMPVIERDLLSDGTANLVITNMGPSAAQNVRVTFDPPAPHDLDSVEGSWREVFKVFAEPVSVWAPGWHLSCVIKFGHRESLNAFTVVVGYAGPDGTDYREAHHIDPAPLLHATQASKHIESAKAAKQQVDVLQALVRAVERR